MGFAPGEGGFERAGDQSAERDTRPSHGCIWIRSSLISTLSLHNLFPLKGMFVNKETEL